MNYPPYIVKSFSDTLSIEWSIVRLLIVKATKKHEHLTTGVFSFFYTNWPALLKKKGQSRGCSLIKMLVK